MNTEIPAQTPPPGAVYKYSFYIVLGTVFGALIGLIIASFMHIQGYLHTFLWEFVPDEIRINTSIYLLLICILGGLAIGICRKYVGDEPKPLDELIKRVKHKQPLPGPKTVPAAYLLSLMSLTFGAALGPEAALAGITMGLGSAIPNSLARISQKFNVPPLEGKLSRIPIIFAIISGFLVFTVLALPMFSIDYDYFPYSFSITLQMIVISVGMSLVGFLLGHFSKFCRVLVNSGFKKLDNSPVISGIAGGVILGSLGIVSPLVLFSGQAEMATLFTSGGDMGGWFLLAVGIMKIIALRTCIASGWKGGEFFPAMFASAAIGLGLSNIFPMVDPMLSIAAVMASSLCVLMGNPLVSIVIVLLFLPVQLLIPIVIASVTVYIISKSIDRFGTTRTSRA